MKYKLLVVILLVAFLPMAKAQVLQSDLAAKDFSIVRTVDAERTIMYAEWQSEAYFVLWPEGGTSPLAVQLPNYLRVRDMRVWGDVAFFCGSWNGTHGIFGQFSISGLFYAGDLIHYQILWSTATTPSIQPMDMLRLKVFEEGGQPCLAMVGKTSPIDSPADTTTIVAAYIGSSGWEVKCL